MDTVRQVQFAEAGAGMVLAFRNADLRVLYGQFGLKFMEDITDGLLRWDFDVLDKCLAVAPKLDGAVVPLKLDDLNQVPLDRLQTKLLDALSLAVNGRLWEEHAKWLTDQLLKRAEEEQKSQKDPLLSPEAFSGGSKEPLSGPASEKASSGE